MRPDGRRGAALAAVLTHAVRIRICDGLTTIDRATSLGSRRSTLIPNSRDRSRAGGRLDVRL